MIAALCRRRPIVAFVAAMAASACLLGASPAMAGGAVEPALVPPITEPAVLPVVAPLVVPPAGTSGLPEGFVKVKDGRLVIGEKCHEFFFAGWNQARPRATTAIINHLSATPVTFLLTAGACAISGDQDPKAILSSTGTLTCSSA